MSARQKGLARKEAAANAKAEAEAAAAEAQEAASWQVGSKKDKSAAKQAEQDAKMARKAEDAAALAAEETIFAAATKKGATKKVKGKDDFSMLDAALKSAPKTKAQKEAEAKKKAQEDRKKAEKEKADKRAAEKEAAEAYRLEQARKGIVVDHSDSLLAHTRSVNSLDEEVAATGIDSALEALKVEELADAHPEKRRKALYQAYLEKELPRWKEDYPGLRLNQYKERIFEAWQKSPENPVNQAAAEGGTA